jgi:WD40 repeat protein
VGTGKNVASYRQAGQVDCATFSPNSRLLAVAYKVRGGHGRASEIRLLQLSNGKEIATITGFPDAVSCIAFSPDGTTLATANVNKTITLWTVPELKKDDK